VWRPRQHHVRQRIDGEVRLLGDQVEMLDRLRLAFFQHLEVVSGQPRHEAAVPVARDDVDLDERGGRLECRLLRRQHRAEQAAQPDLHGLTPAMNRSYLLLPLRCWNTIFVPSSDHAGSSTFLVDSTCCLLPSWSITARRPERLAYAIIPSSFGAQ